MRLKLNLKAISALSVFAMGLAGTASAGWSKGYVIEWYEPAHYYGATSGIIDAGTDCPAGSNPEIDWIGVLVKAGYTEEEAKWLRHPEHPYRIPSHGQNQMAFRGEGRQNVYIKPWTTPDPGLKPVSGTIGEGLDLDGDKTNGFTSPDGKTTGIDNAFYKTLGCWKTYRGPARLSSGALSFNDSMREGSWTIAVVVSGEGDDPMNDDDVTVAFYDSKDPLVKDANGDVAQDYTFTVSPNAKFEAVFDAKSVDGKIISTGSEDEVWFRDMGYSRELQLLKARLELEMKEDGTLSGEVGGYRPWQEVYDGWVRARGTVIESLTWVELPSVWYALKRNADYAPEGANGEKTHISYAMRLDAVPAYVMLPDASKPLQIAASFKEEAEPVEAKVRATPFRVIDGIVQDKNGYIFAGPNAKIIPPTMTREEFTEQYEKSKAAGAGGE